MASDYWKLELYTVHNSLGHLFLHLNVCGFFDTVFDEVTGLD